MIRTNNKLTRTKQALLNRLDEALKDMYHNATPHHPSIEERYYERYNSWFEMVAHNEIEYIQDGLGLTREEWAHQVKLGFIHRERYYWLVSRITEFGKLYQWGRGGRTLAPDGLVHHERGGSGFRMRDASEYDEYSNETLTEYVQIIEAFNHFVSEWCSKENLSDMWQEELVQIEDEELEEEKRKAKEERESKRIALFSQLEAQDFGFIWNALYGKRAELMSGCPDKMDKERATHASIIMKVIEQLEQLTRAKEEN